MPVDKENGSPPYIVNPVYGNRNNTSRSLKIISRNQGWDPDVIIDTKTKSAWFDMRNWDVEPDSFYHKTTGQLPQGVPDTYPDAEQPHYEESVTWNVPKVEREKADNSTNNGDPYSGMGGM